MALFSFGREKSKSQSQQSSFGYSTSQSESSSLSGGSSVSSSGSAARSFTDIAFADIFRELYSGATGAADRAANLVPALADQARQLFGGGVSFLDDLQAAGAPDAGADYLAARVAGESPVLDEQIGALGEDLSRFFGEQLNPQITEAAVRSGALGGGRQGVAQGLATEAVAREFARGATSLRAADVAARDAAARDLSGNLRATEANRIAAAGTGLGALPGLFGIAQGGFGAELAPYQALASILGGPVTLAGSESTSSSSSAAYDFAEAVSRATGYSEERSQGSSISKSGGFNIGF